VTITELLKQLKSVFNIVNTFLKDKGLPADNELYDAIYKIVKKEDPLKPMYDKQEETYYCPCCKKDFGYDNYDYCPDCGQHINWSEK